MGKRKRKKKAIQYEVNRPQVEVGSGKVLTTPSGDKINVMRTADNKTIITFIGQANPIVNSIVITIPQDIIGTPQETESIISVIETIIKISSQVNSTQDDGNPVNFNISINCSKT